MAPAALRNGASGATRDVLITGASRGFGRLIAAGLAARGWRIFAAMRDPAERGGLDDALAASGVDPTSVTVLALDVCCSESIEAAVAQVLARTAGRLDAVVANAGIFAAGAFEETPSAVMRAVMETNYFGAIETVRATLPALRLARGRIVLMSSDSGLCGTPAMSGYTASKYAIEGFGESLAHELRPLGVSLSIVEPGPFLTEIFASAEVHRGGVDSPYAALADATASSIEVMRREAPAPDPVFAAVLRALSVRRPKLRYPVGVESRLISASRGLLSERAFTRLVLRLTGTGALR